MTTPNPLKPGPYLIRSNKSLSEATIMELWGKAVLSHGVNRNGIIEFARLIENFPKNRQQKALVNV